MPDLSAIITFMGFTESDAARTGTEDLFFDVIRPLSCGTITTYHPREWTTDTKAMARQIQRQEIRNVALVSYSHGQAAACDFAKECYQLGIEVDLWLACDPVYRPTWLPRYNWAQPLAFRSLIKKSAKITVPANIKRVAGVRQKVIIPCGHDLKVASSTAMEPLEYLPYSHTQIDGSPEWFDLVKKELQEWMIQSITV